MIDPAKVLEFGFAAVVTAVLLVWVRQLVEKFMQATTRMTEVVAANADALRKVAEAVDRQCESLGTHDEHSQATSIVITRIDERTQRLEAKINKALGIPVGEPK